MRRKGEKRQRAEVIIKRTRAKGRERDVRKRERQREKRAFRCERGAEAE